MTIMTSWDLFEDLRGAQEELARMNRTPGHWAAQFSPQPGTGPAYQAWAPALDITEREGAYLVEADLPGTSAEDVEITLQDGLLTIQGERHPAGGTPGEKLHRAERRHGAFRRSVTLPRHIQADKIEASARDGVLEIVVPKAREAHARRVPVRAPKAKAAVDGKTAVAGKAVKNGS